MRTIKPRERRASYRCQPFEHDRLHTAYHETAHAIAAFEMKVACDGISIVSDGLTAGRIVGVEGGDGFYICPAPTRIRQKTNPDFVFMVTRDFVRNCKTPVLILPDDVPAHPYAVAMESARLAPNSEVSLYPWKASKEHIAEAVSHVRKFLRAHAPVAATA